MFMRMARWFVTCAVFGVVFVVNPAWVIGCGGDEEPDVDKKKIEAELVEHLTELNGMHTWGFEEGGKQYELDLVLERATKADTEARAKRRAVGFMQTAHACGSTTFYASASACITQYILPVKGTLTLRRIGDDAATIVSDVEVRGELEYGLRLVFGESSLEIGNFGSTTFDPELRRFQAQDLGDEKQDFDYSK